MQRFVKAIALLPIVALAAYMRLLRRRSPVLAYEADAPLSEARSSLTQTASHDGPNGRVSLAILAPNTLCHFRAMTFSEKEPETLEWLDRFGGDGALYDVGANIGLYSLYYAQTHAGQVFAFEPSVLNLALLARNIAANDLSERIVVVPIPLTRENGVATFRMSDVQEGGALSSFGVDYGHDGKLLTRAFSYDMPGASLDSLVASGLISQPPALIKIDVDGIEDLVLSGARDTLKSETLRSVLIEVDDQFTRVSHDVAGLLTNAGFSLIAKRHAPMFDTGDYSTSYNQIWARSE